MAGRRIPCVGAVVRDGAGRILLVRRGQPPEQGRWSIPGGRVEAGEDLLAACAREVLEETSLPVTVGRLLGVVERESPRGDRYVIADYEAVPRSGAGEPVAGSDADEVAWVAPADLPSWPVVTGLVTALTGWGVVTGPAGPG